MTLDLEDTRWQIGLAVNGGFDTPDRVFEMIADEYLDPDELSEEDRDWIRSEVQRQFAEKAQAEATWPGETSWDRLEQAFQRLRLKDIVALHDAGFTMSHGHEDAETIREEQGGAASSLVGYVFYHRQDVEKAVDGLGLYIAFGAYDGSPQSDVKIAEEAVRELRRSDFTVEWAGDPDKRIFLPQIVWQKRSPIRQP